MQTVSAKIFSLIAMLLFFATVGLRLFMLLFDLSGFTVTIFYCLLSAAVAATAYNAMRVKSYSQAFNFKSHFHFDIMSYIGALGFFTDFVNRCVGIYNSIESTEYQSRLYFIVQCVACTAAFLSSLYLVAVGISFNDLNYDFRQLKVFRFMPLLWSIALILLVMQDAVSFESNVDEILKQILLVCGVCFFYRFASETLAQDNESAGRATVLFGRLYSYIAVVYFIDRLMLLFSQKTAVSDFDGIFSVSALLICTFVFFFERNIVANEN